MIWCLLDLVVFGRIVVFLWSFVYSNDGILERDYLFFFVEVLLGIIEVNCGSGIVFFGYFLSRGKCKFRNCKFKMSIFRF